MQPKTGYLPNNLREIYYELGIKKAPIIAKDIAERIGIKYREADLGAKTDGVLRRIGDKALIAINSAIKYDGRKNFAGAHEIGHCRIKGHDEPTYSCSPDDLHTYGSGGKLAEREANLFATELLMPRPQVEKFLKDKSFSFNTVEMMVKEYQVSLTSAALRVVELALDSCALVLTSNRRILWSFKSNSFPFTIRNGNLHEFSYAIDFFNGESKDKIIKSRVVPHAWLVDRGISPVLNVTEESLFMPDLCIALSLIQVPYEDESD